MKIYYLKTFERQERGRIARTHMMSSYLHFFFFFSANNLSDIDGPLQMFLLIRLTTSCFVSHWHMGTEIRDLPAVLKYVQRHMWIILIQAMPYEIIAPAARCGVIFM